MLTEVEVRGVDERKRRVLEALITDYIATAEPVGSRTLSRKYHLGVSSATIRNEMADLEELGFLEQPHTSAGRIPSDKGYRFYVDQLMQPDRLHTDDIARIRVAYRARMREVQWFIHQTARLVSELTAYPSVVLAPGVDEAKLFDVRVLPLGRDAVLLVMQTDAGIIQNHTVSLPGGFDMAELKALAAEFTLQFRGVSIKELKDRIGDPVAGDVSRYRGLWQGALQWMAAVEGDDDKVTVAGPLNILNYPEFRDVDKVRRVLGFLEQEAAIDQWAQSWPADGVQVMIGAESLVDDIQDCSVVTATYRVGPYVVGRLMVLGPRRMHYARVIAIVQAVSEELSQALNWA